MHSNELVTRHQKECPIATGRMDLSPAIHDQRKTASYENPAHTQMTITRERVGRFILIQGKSLIRKPCSHSDDNNMRKGWKVYLDTEKKPRKTVSYENRVRTQMTVTYERVGGFILIPRKASKNCLIQKPGSHANENNICKGRKVYLDTEESLAFPTNEGYQEEGPEC